MIRSTPRLSILFVVAALQGLASVSFVTAASILQTVLGIPESRFGALFLPMLAGSAVASAVGEAVVRAIGRVGAMSVGLFAACLALLCLPLVVQFETRAFVALLGCSGLLGTSLGVSGFVLNAGLFDVVAPAQRPRMLSALHGTLAAGAASAPILLAQFGGEAGWTVSVRVIAGVLLGVAITARFATCYAWSDESDESDEAGETEETAAAADNTATRQASSPGGGELRVWAVAAFLYGLAEATLATWAIVFLSTERGLTVAEGARALSAFWLAMAIGRLAAGAHDGFGSLRTKIVLHAAAIALLFVALGSIAQPGLILWMYLLAGLACSATFPWVLAAAAASGSTTPERAAGAVGVAVTLGLLAGSFGIGGLVERFGMSAVLQVSALGPFLLVALALARPRPRLGPRPQSSSR